MSAAADGLDIPIPQARLVSQLPRVFLMTNTLETGGTERQFVNLSKSLDPGKFSIELGCLKREGGFLDGMDGIVEFSPGGNLYNLRSHRARLALASHLRGQRTAIAHSFDFYSNLMLIPAARLARVLVVIGSHRQLGDLMTPMRFRVQKALYRWCDKVTCNSRAGADYLVNRGLEQERLEVIPNALADHVFASAEPALPRLPGVLRVGMIARMNHPSKNQGSFLRAATTLAAKYPSLEFILVGDGALRAGLESLSESLGLRSRMLFLGDRRDIPAVLASLDISVSPSTSESSSNVILESMAAGVAVVATNVGGNAELIQSGKTGLLVSPDSEEELVAAIERLLLQTGLRLEIGRHAREFVRARHSVEKVRDQYQDLYRSLLVRKAWKPLGKNSAKRNH